MTAPTNSGTTQAIPRKADGTFAKGYHGPGKRKGSREFHTELIDALRKVEDSKKQTAFQRAWEMAWADPTMMAALLRKLLPDLTHQTGQLPPTQVNVIYGHQSPARVQVVEALHTNGA